VTRVKDVAGPRPSSSAMPAAISRPLATSGTRAPWRPVTWPATGAATAITIMAGSSDSPARSGESPRTCCRYRVITNRKPPSTMNASTAITAAPVNGCERKNRSSSSGSGRRRSTGTKTARLTAATASSARIGADVHPETGPWMTA